MITDKKLRYHSKQYLLKFTKTTALSKLDNELSRLREGVNLQHVVSAYIYYNKENHDLLKYDRLRKIRNEYELAVSMKKTTSPYYKIYNSILSEMKRGDGEKDLKRGIAKDIRKWLDDLGISLLYVAEQNKVDYSSLHKFVKKDSMSELSLEKAHKILLFLRRLDAKIKSE